MNYTGYISMVKTSLSSCHHFGFKITNIGIFRFLKNCFRWKLGPKSTQKSIFYERSTRPFVETVSQYIVRPEGALHWIDFYG